MSKLMTWLLGEGFRSYHPRALTDIASTQRDLDDHVRRYLDDHVRTLQSRLGWDGNACTHCGGTGVVVEAFVERDVPDYIQSRSHPCPAQCPRK